jgi:hypothetical protein
MKCECCCEDETHNEECKNDASLVIKTIYGTFRICVECEKNHPIPSVLLTNESK